MQICVLNVVIILLLLLLCSAVSLLPAGDTMGDSEFRKQAVNSCGVCIVWCPALNCLRTCRGGIIRGKSYTGVLSLFFCAVVLCCVFGCLFPLRNSFFKFLFQCNILYWKSSLLVAFLQDTLVLAFAVLSFPANMLCFILFFKSGRDQLILEFVPAKMSGFLSAPFLCIVFLPVDIFLVWKGSRLEKSKNPKPYANKLPLGAVLGTFHWRMLAVIPCQENTSRFNRLTQRRFFFCCSVLPSSSGVLYLSKDREKWLNEALT